MGRVLLLVRRVWGNGVARAIMALAFFVLALAGLAATGYADQYVNGGVTWGPRSGNEPKISYADVNPMGANFALEKEVDPAKIEQTLQMAQDAGFKWGRQGFAWNDIEIQAKGDFTDTRNFVAVSAWAKYDRIVEAYQKHGIEIIARLDSPPVWARTPGDDVEKYHKGPPEHNEDYGDFVAAVAQRYKGKIKYFQIWNEPNLFGEWGGYAVDPAQYTALLKVAHDRIKAVNPNAVIITAALAPTADVSLQNLNDVLFLEGMYRAGAAPYFDILSTMLYGLGQSPEERRTDLKRLNFSRPILLRQVMERNGDSAKAIWISEYAWISIPPDFKGDLGRNIWGQSVDEATQARYLVDGYKRAQTEWPWMGVMSVWYFREPDPDPADPADYFAIVRPDFTPRAAYDALKGYSEQRETQEENSAVIEKHIERDLATAYTRFEFSDTIKFAGASLRVLCHCTNAIVESIDGSPANTEQKKDWYVTSGRESSAEPILSGLSQTTHTAVIGMHMETFLGQTEPAHYFAPIDRGHADAYPEKPLWNAWGFPILYSLFGLFALVSAGVGARGVGRWVEAAVGRPKGRYSEEVREKARDVAAVVGMALTVGVYYKVESLPAIVAALGVWGVIALLKPQLGLAAVAFSIPFFWVQKDYGQQHFPPEETLMMVLFGAVVVRGLVRLVLPEWAARMGITEPPRHQERQENTKIFVGETGDIHRRDAAGAEVIEEEGAGSRPATEVAGYNQANSTYADYGQGAVPEGELRRTSPRLQSQGKGESIVRGTLISGLWKHFKEWNRAEPLGAPALALLLVGTVSLFTLADPAYARDSFRVYRWVIVLPVLFYFLLTDVIRSRRGLLRVADFFVAAAVVVSLVGLWQFAQDTNVLNVQGVSRIQSVYEHPNNLALYLGRVWPFVGCMALFLPRSRRKVAYGLAALPVGATLLLTFSRGAWVAVVIAMLAALFVAWKWGGMRFRGWTRLPRQVRLGVVGVMVAIGLVGAAVILPKLPQRIFEPQSLGMRVLHWQSALEMIRDHPITGVGIDQFLNQFQRADYKYRTREQDREAFTAHPHNFVLDYWVSLGIMGVIVLFWLLWRYFRLAIARVREASARGDPVKMALALGLLGSMVVFVVHGMVDNSYFLMDLASIFWLGCGMLQVMRDA